MTERKPITEPGVYNLSPEVYHGAEIFPAPMLSRSVIKDLLDKSPIHAWTNHPALNPRLAEEEEAEPKFDIGTAAHSLFLEGYDCVAIIEADSWRTNAAKEERANARHCGKVPLLRKEWEKVSRMVEAAKRQLAECKDLQVKDLQAEGMSEQSLIWEEDGIWLKIRPDWMPTDCGYILDYKTTGKNANPEGIGAHIVSMGYDIQDAFYRRGVMALTQTAPKFCLMFQEAVEPYVCSFVSLNPEFAAMGESKVERGINLWRKCLGADEWPGYPTQICYPDPPTWELAREEWRRMMEATV
jgi:hypothetical protein